MIIVTSQQYYLVVIIVMVTVAHGIVTMVCYIVAIIGRIICTKLSSVGIVNANVELSGGVANVTEVM